MTLRERLVLQHDERRVDAVLIGEDAPTYAGTLAPQGELHSGGRTGSSPGGPTTTDL